MILHAPCMILHAPCIAEDAFSWLPLLCGNHLGSFAAFFLP